MNRDVWALGLCLLLTWGCDDQERSRPSHTDAGREQAPAARTGDDDASVPTDEEGAYVDCATIKAGRLPRGLERLESFKGASVLAANEHGLFGTRTGAVSEELWTRSTPSGAPRVIVYEGADSTLLVPDGDRLFFNRDSGEVSSVPIAGGPILFIGPAAFSLLPVDNFIYALGYGDSRDTSGIVNSTALLRSDREPGATHSLGTVDGFRLLAGALTRAGNALYFALTLSSDPNSTPGAQLYRFDLQDEHLVPLGQPAGIATLASDGETLFAGLIGMSDALGNPSGALGVARVKLEDGTLEPLFPDLKERVRMVTVDGSAVYWMSDAAGPSSELWRADKTGAGARALVATGWLASTGLTQNADGIYWTVPCGDVYHVLRATK